MSMVEAVAIALLNDDRTRHGLPETETLDGFADADAYRSSARAAIRTMANHGLIYRDNGQVVHELRGAPNDIWKTMLATALAEDGEG